mmetsp:Transcript_3722/g.4882  ORF Transcript_3722/g.4882 Transcript_3722/m.4882 type:complete len:98 (+) Transcript_3722:408-701(+)
MESPSVISGIMINKYLEGNASKCAVLTNSLVTIHLTTAIQTTCSGKHCDKQRPMDWAFTTTRGCDCWGTTRSLGTSKNIALMHTVLVRNGRNEQKIK